MREMRHQMRSGSKCVRVDMSESVTIIFSLLPSPRTDMAARDRSGFLFGALQTSHLTAKQFRAHKSLEAYNQFVCCWMKDVIITAWKVEETAKIVVTGKYHY